VIYLDTSCLVKLYYPEPESARVAALVQGKAICCNSLHELEFHNALQLKMFAGAATSSQTEAARQMVAADLHAGVLVSPLLEWKEVFAVAVRIADEYTRTIGCRSLDILHCAAARMLESSEFVTTDARQKKLAAALGLKLAVL
jgi:predicted nucleic acid-binding protein